jgi:hypothetical protein|tara:strand:+ start:90183 stop:93362 length:3180 start_codon:yes stop_codon:yes gene_type:complete
MHNSSPSTNIIRDSNVTMNYIVTPNADDACKKVFNNLELGNHAFNIIGSFGTGKSSFLLALEKSLLNKHEFFKTPFNGKTKFIKIIGEYKSFSEVLNEEFGVKDDHTANQKLFDAIFQEYEAVSKKGGLLILAIDEFGKFLEYAAKNQPEREIYFLQKLAEFVNKPDRNILLITSIHQSLESYAHNLSKVLFREWTKVKGRFIDLTFNEPVEQLLLLASQKIESEATSTSKNYYDLIARHNLYNIHKDYAEQIRPKLYPLSIISAYTLATALQRYGQNERSLFTFLNSFYFSDYKSNNKRIELPEVYNYLFQEFYTFLVNKNNPDYSNWAGIRASIEKEEIIEAINHELSQKILKSIGLLSIFSKKGSIISLDLFTTYFEEKYSEKEIEKTINTLEKHKIIRYSKFDSSYKLFEGTDLDIEQAISNAEHRVGGIDILKKLTTHFDFPILIAKSITYRKGTPRLFEFIISNKPEQRKPIGQIDGFVNLIFNEDGSDIENLLSISKRASTLFGYFTNTSGIFETLLEIEKTKEVLKDMQDQNDRVAIRELKSIIKSNEVLLNHYVMDSLYTNRVLWFSNGKQIKLETKKAFNQALSAICDTIYPDTPILQNELFNRHKTSGSISSARKNFWKALTSNADKKDLGFPEDKWPAEKTIYHTLLKKTGIHKRQGDKYTLAKPTQSDFLPLWELSIQFLNEAKSSRKSLLDFIEMLETAPIKLKQGVIDFWAPTFLYLKRGDFALYNDNGFVPYLDETVLYFMTRTPKEFYIKSFELNDLRLSLFNKYRDFLQQENTTNFDSDSFIESIRPLLIFYRDLPEYNKKTKTVSKEAVQLREAISKAKDPEKTFFEDFPQALGYSLSELATDTKLFEDYIIDFQHKIEEIKQSFDELLNRFELFICDEVIGQTIPFESYKTKLHDRFSSIKEHQALTRHKVFLLRVNSDLPDRNSYLMSIAQAILGKRLDAIKDTDEAVLKDKLLSLVHELDNLVDLNTVSVQDDEEIMKLELTTLTEGSKNKTIRISNKQTEEINSVSNELLQTLNKHKNLKLPILLSMLQKELDQDE